MELGLTGKTVLITGAGSGIGQTMALAFAAEGARVVVNDVSAAKVAATCGMIGADAVPVVCDISDLAAVQAMMATLGDVDVLVNNAAILLAHSAFVDTRPEDCAREIQVILFGTMNCTRAVLPGMIARRAGKIINIVSDAARIGQEHEASYSAAKGGVLSFTRTIAREVGRHNVNVNAVSPSATNTPLRQGLLRQMAERLGEEAVRTREEKVRRVYPLRRIGEPEDVAAAVLFLASTAARHITGQVLSVNGGFAMT